MKKMIFLSAWLFIAGIPLTGYSAKFSFLTIRNNTPGYIKVYIDGRLRGFIKPNMAKKFNVHPGVVNVEIRDKYGKTFSKTFHIRPGQNELWSFSYPVDVQKTILQIIKTFKPQTGILLLTNSNSFPVNVNINGKPEGVIPPYESREFTVASGFVKVVVSSAHGSDSRNFNISPGEYEEWEIFIREVERTGTIEIINNSSVTLEVFINNAYRGEVLPGGTNSFIVNSGSVEVTLSDGNIEKSRQIQISRGEKITWRVRPEDFSPPSPEIEITNSTPTSLNVFLNGRSAGTLNQGEVKTFNLLSGNNSIELRGNGFTLQMSVDASPGKKIRWNPSLQLE